MLKKLIIGVVMLSSVQAVYAWGYNNNNSGGMGLQPLAIQSLGTSNASSNYSGNTSTNSTYITPVGTGFGYTNTMSSPTGTTTTGTVIEPNGNMDFIYSNSNRW